MGILIVQQREPFLLPGLGGERQMANRGRIDLLGAIEVADAGQQVAEREGALDLQGRQPESVGDILRGASFLDEPGKGFPASHLIRVRACDIFNERGFERCGIVARRHDGTGQRIADPGFFRHDERGMVAPLARDDLIGFGRPVLTHDERHQHPARPDGRQDIGEVRRFPHAPHIGGRDGKIGNIDMLEFHDFTPWLKHHRPGENGVGGKSEPAGPPSDAASIHMYRTPLAAPACRLPARRGGPRGQRRPPRFCRGRIQRHRATAR